MTVSVASGQLRAFVERIERLSEEKKTIEDDIRDVLGEAKSMGFCTKTLKKIVALRKKDENERAEEEAILGIYMAALGMIPQMDMFEDDAPKAKSPAMALQSPRKAAEAVSERTAINPVANVEEGATGAIAAASIDPASRTDEGGERQHSSTVGFTGDCRTEGKEQSDASAASVGDAAANAHGIPEPIQPGTEEGESNEVAHDHSHAATAGTRIDHIVPATPGITFEECPPKPMRSLPFAHCFPELTKSKYDQLSALIEENGVEEPIIRSGDIIVDGWNRYNIARSLGIAYPVKQFEGGDILSFVIAAQRSARDWLPSQERKIAAALCKELPHRANDIMAAFHIEEEFA